MTAGRDPTLGGAAASDSGGQEVSAHPVEGHPPAAREGHLRTGARHAASHPGEPGVSTEMESYKY